MKLCAIDSDVAKLRPEVDAQINALLVTGPGLMPEVPPLTFKFLPLAGFSTAANSKVPHNALHDARAPQTEERS